MASRRDVDPTASAAALYAYKLRADRDGKSWTQDALADRVGCTGDLISKIETAKRSATLEMSRHFDRLFALDAYFEELQPLAARELELGGFRPFLEAADPGHSNAPGRLQAEAHTGAYGRHHRAQCSPLTGVRRMVA